MTAARRAVLLLAISLAACGRDDAPHDARRAPVAATKAPAAAKPPVDAPATPARPALPTVAVDELDDALKRADAALAAGRIEGDATDYGALEWYVAARNAAPEDPRVQAGVERGLDALLERGRIAMRVGDLDGARRIGDRTERLQRDHRDLAAYRSLLSAAVAAEAAVAAADAAAQANRFAADRDDAAPAALQRALALSPGYRPALAMRERWVGERLERAWAAAQADRYDDAVARLQEAAALHVDAPALQAMRLRVGERRLARTQSLLAEGQAALGQLDIAAATRALASAEKIAAQPAGVERLRERIFLARHYGHFEPGQVFAEPLVGGGRGPEMTVVRFGVFRMGKDDDRFPAEGPEREVTFERGYAIGRNEVTVADFRRFVEATHYRTRATREGHATVFDERGGSMAEHEGVDWQLDFLGRKAADDRPVIHVSFEDAQAYADWLSEQTGARYRLPSEAEWEYALRAGRRAEYPWGDDAPPPKGIGNLSGEGDKSSAGRSWGTPIRGYTDFHWGTAPVRSFAVEPWGTFDMVGNVSEWVLDCWHDSYRRAPLDGSAWINPGCPRRVVRGASWASALDPARSAARMSADAKSTQPWLGFRVVRDI
jgi:formylglycine-generating enzyme required for sulfatase activity